MVSLHQLVAMAFVYRRVVRICGALPLFMLLFPILSTSVLWALKLCATTDYIMLAIVLTVALTAAGRKQIHRLATSQAVLEASLQKNLVRLPMAMFAVACILSRTIIGPALDRLGLSLQWTASSGMGFATALRVATAMGFLGAFVAARFIGPTSIMRCSYVPLVSNPFDVSVRYLLEHPLSLFEPGDSPSELLTPSFQRRLHNLGRRFQRPTSQAYAQHIILGIATGVASFYAGFSQFHEEPSARTIILICCILSCLGTTLWVLDGVSHELDPKQYLYTPKISNTILRNEIAKKIVCVAISAPLLSFVVAMLTSTDDRTDISVASLFMQLTIISALIATYVFLVDGAIRLTIFNPRADMQQLVAEIKDDKTLVTRLGIMLQSILCDPYLVKEVWNPNLRQTGLNAPEKAELQLSDRLTKIMQSVLLTRIDPLTEAPLEEDVLRINILESLGGDKSNQPGQASERHKKSVNEWVDQPITRSQKNREHLSVPLVRGLTVYIGGLGEALEVCAASTKPVRGAGKRSSAITWTLAPAAFVCAEMAVHATARCIVRSLTPSDRALSDWKSSNLATQVPAVLTALFLLQKGTLLYSNYVADDGKMGVRAKIAIHNPALWAILHSCDSAATSILKSLKTLKGLGRIDLSLDKDCLEWTNGLLAKESNK